MALQELESRDRLRELVDVLVETLAERLDGAEVARRAFLSRFHYDRILSAALREPPGALRRRLLLERAAHALAHDDAPVTDVALAAGYGSLEAFSRAFRRAYGSAPSEFRRAPGRLRLPAPNGVHFHPPAGLILPGTTERSSAMDLVDRLVEHDLWLTRAQLERAATLSDEVLDRPIELSVESLDPTPTLRSLLAHLVGSKEQWAASIEGRPAPLDDDRTVAGLRRRLDAAGPEFARVVRDVRDRGDWDSAFVDALCDPPQTFTFGGAIAHALTFAAHRRTLVAGALYGEGIRDLGPGDPISWERRLLDGAA